MFVKELWAFSVNRWLCLSTEVHIVSEQAPENEAFLQPRRAQNGMVNNGKRVSIVLMTWVGWFEKKNTNNVFFLMKIVGIL